LGGFALNVRTDQLSADGRALRVSRQNLLWALRLIDRALVLYRPRDEIDHGYYGVARILNVEQDGAKSNFIWLELSDVAEFPKVVTLDELYGAVATNDTPFHTYSRAVRPVTPYELARLFSLPGVPNALGLYEETIQAKLISDQVDSWTLRKVRLHQRALRAELLRVYGPRCAFTDEVYTSLSSRLFETNVGHLISLEYGGPSIIQNTLPMTGTTNWHWDGGLISATNSGHILVSAQASSSTRRLFEAGRKIRFANSKYWPRAEFLEWHRDCIFEKGRQPGLQWSGLDPA